MKTELAEVRLTEDDKEVTVMIRYKKEYVRAEGVDVLKTYDAQSRRRAIAVLKEALREVEKDG